jgi:hypothetical protein
MLAGLCLPPAASAQARSGVIRGLIKNIKARTPLEGARISLVGTPFVVTSDARGEFRFGDLDPGQYVIQASAIGYTTMSSPLLLKEAEILDVEFEADPEAVNLPELTVEERANYGPVDWIRRKSEGQGRYITRKSIEDRRASTVPDALRMVPGLRIECRGSQVCVARMARAPRNCSPAYFMDGIPADAAVLWLTPVGEIEGIEVYAGPSETPAELESAQARCGVIALWTRPPPPRRPKEKKPKPAADSTHRPASAPILASIPFNND